MPAAKFRQRAAPCSLADAVELGAVIGDDPGENVEAAGRALRVGGGRGALSQRQELEQRHDVDAVLLQHCALGQLDAVHRQEIELVAHARPGARQKTRPHAIGDLAEAQIDARGLDLIVADRLRRQDLAPQRRRLAQHLRRQQTGRAIHVGRVRRGEQVVAMRLGHSGRNSFKSTGQF